MLCRCAALELSKVAEECKKKYPKNVIWCGIGKIHQGSSVFKSLFPRTELYMAKSDKLFSMLNSQSPGCLECWGVCNSTLAQKIKEAEIKIAKNKKIDSDMKNPPEETEEAPKKIILTFGATIVTDNRGRILFLYKDRCIGDYPNPANLLDFIDTYFEETVDPNYPEIEADPRVD